VAVDHVEHVQIVETTHYGPFIANIVVVPFTLDKSK